MKGGEGQYTIPIYKEPVSVPAHKEPMNNPMIPNEQRRIYNESKQQNPQTQQNPQQILNLQLYQPKQPKQTGPPRPNPAVFYPNYVPTPFDPMGYAAYMHSIYHGGTTLMPPIYKEYNINIGGISGSHVTTAAIYEDALPIRNVSGTFNSLGERITLYESIRSILFSGGDGRDIPIEEQKSNLLSHIKLMDMNPYNAARYTSNPYKGLPFGFLLYRSCYPIRHDARNATTMCSNNSTGINLRVYRLTEGAYAINKEENIEASDYDEWRDMAFYNFVKEHILKRKVCPNFVMMYGYNITLKSGINFDEMKRILSQPKQSRRYYLQQLKNPLLLQQRQTKEELLKKYMGKALVCLTEAPNYNMLNWCKKEYRSEGNKKTMINTGYHTKAVWESVLFQLMAAIYTMQVKGIIINNFRLERNVFVKDINIGGNVTNYWKYKIRGIDYYIPNYGYLVLIDTNYRDFDVDYTDKETDKTRERKIDGKFIGDKFDADECIKKGYEALLKVMDVNIYGQDFINDNGVKPPEDILRLIGDISSEASTKKILSVAYYIRKFMTMFLNNRVGTPLTDVEMGNVKRGNRKIFRRGEIVTTLDSDGKEKFVIHITSKDDKSLIITKDGIKVEEKEVPTGSLNSYSQTEPIKQNFKMTESNLSEESLLETYILE